jgi:hypothetical protein
MKSETNTFHISYIESKKLREKPELESRKSAQNAIKISVSDNKATPKNTKTKVRTKRRGKDSDDERYSSIVGIT